MKHLATPGLVLGLAALAVVPALAHAALVSAVPGPGDVVPQPLTQIILNFDDEITPSSQIQLIASDFQLAADWTQSVEGATLTATLDNPLPPGTYTLVWTAVSADAHTTTGSYQFAVSQARSGVSPWLTGLVLAAGLLILLAGVVVWRRRTSDA